MLDMEKEELRKKYNKERWLYNRIPVILSVLVFLYLIVRGALN